VRGENQLRIRARAPKSHRLRALRLPEPQREALDDRRIVSLLRRQAARNADDFAQVPVVKKDLRDA
jgi:hypothetical protein